MRTVQASGESDKKLLVGASSLILGGKEKFLVSLVNGLAGTGAETTIVSFSSRNDLAREVRSGRVIAVERTAGFDIAAILSFRKLLLKERYTHYLAFDIFSYLFFRIASFASGSSPVSMISIHSNIVRSWKEDLQWRAVRRLLKSKDRIISICDAQQDFFSQTYSFNRSVFTTIYNGVDTDWFDPRAETRSRDEICAMFKLNPGKRYVVQVANFRPEKDHECSLRALSLLAAFGECVDVRLIFAGSGSEEHRIRSLAERIGVLSRVDFAGRVEDVRALYSIASAFTLSSRVEAFSIACLEAMAMGLAAVITNVGGAAEMISTGVNGYLVPPGDPAALANGWKSVIGNSWQGSGANIRAIVLEKFSLKKCTEAYDRLLFGVRISDGSAGS